MDEPARQLHERVLDEVFRKLTIAGEQVREAADIGRVPLEQLYEEPTLELDLSDLHPRALSCPPFSNARAAPRVDALATIFPEPPGCFKAERVHEVAPCAVDRRVPPKWVQILELSSTMWN
jgi:hypothetical protein